MEYQVNQKRGAPVLYKAIKSASSCDYADKGKPVPPYCIYTLAQSRRAPP